MTTKEKEIVEKGLEEIRLFLEQSNMVIGVTGIKAMKYCKWLHKTCKILLQRQSL